MRIAIAVQYCAEWTKKRMIENVREIDTTYIWYFTVQKIHVEKNSEIIWNFNSVSTFLIIFDNSYSEEWISKTPYPPFINQANSKQVK